MEELYKRKIPPVINTKENLTAKDKNKTDEPYETSLKSGSLFIEPRADEQLSLFEKAAIQKYSILS